MPYVGIYLLIGVIVSHFVMSWVTNKIKKEIENDEVGGDSESIIKQVDSLQRAVGYRRFIILAHTMTAIIWLPAIFYVLFKKITNKSQES